ncbi:hypothetical protein D9M71_186290 [compost metagenome]
MPWEKPGRHAHQTTGFSSPHSIGAQAPSSNQASIDAGTPGGSNLSELNHD